MAFWNEKQERERRARELPSQPPAAPSGPEREGEARRDEPRDRAAPTPPPTPAGGADLLLGAGAEFEGKLTFRGTVRIDAIFRGSIVTNDVLVVGERARIDAEITCGTVIVHGEVNGNIKAKSGVELLGTARVRGDVEASSIRVDKGARLTGWVRRAEAERGAPARPPPSAPEPPAPS